MYECIKRFTVTLEGIGTLEIEVGTKWWLAVDEDEAVLSSPHSEIELRLSGYAFKNNFRKMAGKIEPKVKCTVCEG